MKPKEPLKSLDDLDPADARPGTTDLPLDKWLALIDAFRKQSTVNYKAAAAAAGTQASTAKKAYEDGNDRLRRPAIRDILLLEARKARSEVERRFEKLSGSKEERLHANRDAVSVRAHEGKLVHGVGITADALLSVTATLLKGCQPLAQRCLAEMTALSTGEKTTVKEILSIIREVRDLARTVTEVVEGKLDLERKLLGDPTGVANFTAEITPAEAVEELRNIDRLFTRLAAEDENSDLVQDLKAAGVPLKLILGGKNPPKGEPETPAEATAGMNEDEAANG